MERLIGDVLKLAAAATREALDTSTLPSDDEAGAKGKSAAAAAAMQQQRGPSKAHAAAWKTTLWSRMEALTEALLSRAWQVPPAPAPAREAPPLDRDQRASPCPGPFRMPSCGAPCP